MREEEIVHLPEPSLRVRGLCRLRGDLGVLVHVDQRQIPEDEPEIAPELPKKLPDDGFGPAAMRTLEVAVLHQRDRRVLGAPNVVDLERELGAPPRVTSSLVFHNRS